VERGDLRREKRGKAYFYSPGRPKQNALAELSDGLAKVFSAGSKAGLIAQLLQDESLSPEDVRHLTSIAGMRDHKPARKSNKHKR
jgi:predicted transcriptional regulator